MRLKRPEVSVIVLFITEAGNGISYTGVVFMAMLSVVILR